MSTLSLNDFRYADRSTDRDSDTSFLVEGVPHNFAAFDVIAIRAAGWIDLAVANADNIILAVVTKAIRLTYTFASLFSWTVSTSYGYISGSGVSHTLTHNLNMLANTGKITYIANDGGQGG